MGWSTYADFSSVESLKMAVANNVIRAVSLAFAERANKKRNTILYKRLFTFPITGSYLSLYYTAIVDEDFVGSFLDPITFEPMTLAKIAEEVEILPTPNTKLMHGLESKYWYMFAEILNRLICSEGMPNVVSLEEYNTENAAGDFYARFGTGFYDLVDFLNSNLVGSIISGGSTTGGGGWTALCVSTQNDHWISFVNRHYGTIVFDTPVSLLWKTQNGANNTWSGNFTDVPIEWTAIATNSISITIPRWNLLSVFPYTPEWASVNGTNNQISQEIYYKYYRHFNASGDGSFEFIEGS